jgi:signal transduction histidine kinase/phage shock protein PspC (stress-responsive transcriptional regulator)
MAKAARACNPWPVSAPVPAARASVPEGGGGAALGPRLHGGRLLRSRSDRLLLGVAGGLGRRIGVDPLLIRMAFGVLLAAGGLGGLLYLLGWVLSVEPPGGADPEPRRPLPMPRQVGAVTCIALGLLLVSRSVGLWFGDALVWPVALAVAGSAVIWARGGEADRRRWSQLGERLPGDPLRSLFGGRAAGLRVAIGAILVAGGMGAFLAANRALAATRSALLAVVVTAAGLGLLLGPWIARLARDAADERRRRVRSEERAEIAAHLHDSVLHTLALIQRSDAPAEITSLARRQERELRAWLDGRPAVSAEVDLRGAVDALASRVEEHHGVTVETVVVGDAEVDQSVRALLDACQEAAVNASRHAGVARVSLYVEVDDEAVTAYVRDEGRGFDPALVPSDRRGIVESIVGRMRRHGGSATVVSRTGEGTEVQLRLPRARP